MAEGGTGAREHLALLPRLPGMIGPQVNRISGATVARVRALEAVRQALGMNRITIRSVEAGRGVIADHAFVPVKTNTGTILNSVVAGTRFGNFRRSVEIGWLRRASKLPVSQSATTIVPVICG